MRRFFLIVIIIVIIAVGIWLGYLAWKSFSGAETIIEEEGWAVTENKEIIKSDNPLKQITNTSIANFWVNASSNQIFLINYNGKIEKLENLKTKTTASDNGLKNISQVMPSPDGSKVLINLTIFDGITNIWTPLPAGTTAAVWSPSANLGQVPTIAYLTNDGLYNLKDGKTSLIFKLNNRDLQITWPVANEIYLTEKPTEAYNAASWKFNIKDKTLTRGVFDRFWEKLINLQYLTPGRDFNILPPKCLVVEKGFYCAIPNNSEVTLNNYLKRKVYTNDDIYFVSVDIEKKKAQAKLLLGASETNPIDAINLSLYKDKLLFINRYDQRLYSLETK